MSFTKKAQKLAVATGAAAVLTLPLLICQPAGAAPVAGSCSGGVIDFDSSPISLDLHLGER